MKYAPEKKEIILKRKLSELDKMVLRFIKILEKHVDYVIISGYISILLGRARATEDVDIFIQKISEEQFLKLYTELKKSGFWCINAEDEKEVFSYLKDNLAVRFAEKDKVIPNFEVKFPKRIIDQETFNDFIIVKTEKGNIKISSLERQIAFKKYYLKSRRDIEDALHIEELFKGKLDYNKIDKLKMVINSIKT